MPPEHALVEIALFRIEQRGLSFFFCVVYIEGLEAEPNGLHYHQIFLPIPVTRHLLDGFLLPSPTCRVWSVCCFHSWLIPLPLEPRAGG